MAERLTGLGSFVKRLIRRREATPTIETPLSPESPYRILEADFKQLDALIPTNGLEIWHKGLRGNRVSKPKEFQPQATIRRTIEIWDQAFTNPQQRDLVIQAAHRFLITLIDTYPDIEWNRDTVPLGQIDRTLVNFPHNLMSRLGPGCTAETLTRIFGIGTTALNRYYAHIEGDEVRRKYFTHEAGMVALMIGEQIPQVVGQSGRNQNSVLASLESNIGSSISSLGLRDLAETHQKIVEAASTTRNPEAAQAAVIEFIAGLREIDPEIAGHQFKSKEAETLMQAVEAVSVKYGIEDPQEAAGLVLDPVIEGIKSTKQRDPIAAHFLAGNGMPIITAALSSQKMPITREAFKSYAKNVVQTAADFYVAINGRRTGIGHPYARETTAEDWSNIAYFATNYKPVARVLQLADVTGGRLPVSEFMGWITTQGRGVTPELHRISGLILMGEIFANTAQRQGVPQNQLTAEVAEAMRVLNDLPTVAHFKDRETDSQLRKYEYNIPFSQLIRAFLSLNRIFAELSAQRTGRDYQRNREERLADQLARGLSFAFREPAFRDQLLERFSRNPAQASLSARGFALIEDAFKGHPFDEAVFDVSELTEVLPDPGSQEQFLDTLALFMQIYDHQQTQGERALLKDALDLVLDSDDPSKSLGELVQGGIHALKSGGWVKRLAGEQLGSPMFSAQRSLDQLTAQAVAVPVAETQALAVSRKGGRKACHWLTQITRSV